MIRLGCNGIMLTVNPLENTVLSVYAYFRNNRRVSDILRAIEVCGENRWWSPEVAPYIIYYGNVLLDYCTTRARTVLYQQSKVEQKYVFQA